jgi:hypothetical protein
MRLLILLTTLTGALAQTQHTSTAASAVAKARATALTLSSTSNVAGRTFNRVVSIWLENTDYSLAAGDRTVSPIPISSPSFPSLLLLTLLMNKMSGQSDLTHTHI